MKIPTGIIRQILEYIKSDVDLADIDEKQSQKLVKILIELWYFIYERQIDDDLCKNLFYYTNINNKQLRNFNIMMNGLRLKHNKLLLILKYSKLIDINDIFSEGRFSMGYRINLDFINGDYTEINLDFNKIFDNTKNKCYWLEKYSDKMNLIEDAYNSTIDLSEYLNWMIDNKDMELKPVLNKNNGMLEKRYLTDERIWLYFNLALKINMKNIWFKISDEGRFYSSISNLPYTAVPFLKLYNQKTLEVDIKNSQPLLLSVLIKNDKYKNDVVNGIFYDRLANELGWSRNDTKIMSYKYIFFSYKPLKSGKIYNAMKNIYGTLIDDINTLKSDIKLSTKLQEMEANIFVNRIGKLRIKKLLRHDQVIVCENDLEIMKNYLRLEYKKLKINLNI